MKNQTKFNVVKRESAFIPSWGSSGHSNPHSWDQLQILANEFGWVYWLENQPICVCYDGGGKP